MPFVFKGKKNNSVILWCAMNKHGHVGTGNAYMPLQLKETNLLAIP